MNVIISNKELHKNMAGKIIRATGEEVVFIGDKEKVSYDYLMRLNPNYVFFPHWSDIIPAEVYENFECIVFHMTDLPFGRGGSPLQNLIVRGYTETKLSAIRCVRELDAGDIYIKRELSLSGTAREIFLRARNTIQDMIVWIIKNKPVPTPQVGEATLFKRRKPKDGNIEGIEELEKVYDYIRMLDAEGYPRAFADIGNLHLEFERASFCDGEIKADVTITVRDR